MRRLLFLSLVILVLGAAACTQARPSVPTPTLVPLNQTPVLPVSATETPGALATAEPALGTEEPTPGAGEPTLLPTPIVVGPAAETPSAQATETTAPTTTDGQSTDTGACPNPYTVQRGDWLYAIARKCGVSARALMAANPGVSQVYPGQRLVIPGGGAPPPPGGPPPSGGGGTYVVRPGDNLFRIGLRFGVNYRVIAAANGIPFPYSVYVGQVLRIP